MKNDKTCWPIIATIALSIMAGGCKSGKKQTKAKQTIKVSNDQLHPFLTFKKDSLAQPVDMTFLPDGNLAVLDYKLKQVLVYNQNGQLQTRFGKSGKGPGEFVRPISIQATKANLYVFDSGQLSIQKFTLNGGFVKSNKGSGETLSGLSLIDAIILTNQTQLRPAQGKKGHLVEYINTKTDSSFYFGKAMGDSISVVDLSKNKQQLNRGEVPDIFKNAVFLAAGVSAYYVFLKGYGRLQKYDHSGDLLWEKTLHFPFMKKVHENAIKRAKKMQANAIAMFNYAYDMKIAGGLIYLLMNTPHDHDRVILAFDKNGRLRKRYDINLQKGSINGIALAPSGEKMFLIDGSLGRVLWTQINNN